jgi:hypothetical protein
MMGKGGTGSEDGTERGKQKCVSQGGGRHERKRASTVDMECGVGEQVNTDRRGIEGQLRTGQTRDQTEVRTWCRVTMGKVYLPLKQNHIAKHIIY